MELNQHKWLSAATRGIRFGPDRKAVEQELREHIEDKTADLLRIFPDMTEQEAAQRVLSQMGDAEEIGRALARVHKPWLGYLWRASKWVLGLLTAACLVYGAFTCDHYQSAGHPLWGAFRTVSGPVDGPSAQCGEYTFQIVGAAYLDYPEDWVSYRDGLQVSVRVSSPRFWARVDQDALLGAMTAVAPDGTRWDMNQATVETIWENGAAVRNRLLTGASLSEWDFFSRTFSVYLCGEHWPPDGRVCLEFEFPQGSFTLTTEIKERVVAE